jgi:hypothetical protein
MRRAQFIRPTGRMIFFYLASIFLVEWILPSKATPGSLTGIKNGDRSRRKRCVMRTLLMNQNLTDAFGAYLLSHHLRQYFK